MTSSESTRVLCWLATWLVAACSTGGASEPGTSTPRWPEAPNTPDAEVARRDAGDATPASQVPTGRASDAGVASTAGSSDKSGSTPSNVVADAGKHDEGAAGGAPGSQRGPAEGAAASINPTDTTGMDAGSNRQCFGIELPPRVLTSVAPDLRALEPYYPTHGFRSAEPAAAGMDGAKLEAAISFSTPHSNTSAILVLRKGYIVAERYFGASTADTRFESFSLAKGFVSALVGIAIGAGKIPGVDERLCKYYPEHWDCEDASDPRSRITLRHAMNLQTGLDWSEDWTPEGLATNDTIWGVLNLGLLDYVLAQPAAKEPGGTMTYSTGASALMSGVIQGATGKTAFEYAKEVLFGPIGTPDIKWNTDLKGRTTTFAGLQATLREYAKFGYLYSKHGRWEDREIVPASWVDLTTQRVSECEDRYRFLWHLNPPVRFGMPDATTCTSETFLTCKPLSLANLPGEGFFAQGITGQFIFIFPTTDLVVVRMASDEFNGAYWDEYAREMLARVFDSIVM